MNAPDVIRLLFDGLAAEWRRTRPHSSRVKDLAAVPAYREIVKMGLPVIPLILEDMEKNGPDHWFHALYEITGANPVKEENRGQLKKMAEDWPLWWRGQQTSTIG